MRMNSLRLLRPAVSTMLFAICLCTAVLTIAWQALHLSTYDLRVPLTYSEGDSVIIAMYAKGLLQDGWPNTITHLSAPFAYPGAAFPLMTSVDWLIMKAMSLFTSEAGLLLNAFWLFTLVAGALAAAYSSHQLGVRPSLAFAGGILYAFLPFALLRNVHHLNLVYYLVPLLCLLASLIASNGKGVRNARQATYVGLVACVLQGFDYAYFAFFAVVLFAAAGIIAFRRDNLRTLGLPVVAALLVTAATVVNLLPALHTWSKNGTPPEMGYKTVAEAEIYGAKLRKMIAPHPDNAMPPFGWIARKDAASNFPNENENTTARLGLYGAAGLLVIMIAMLRRYGKPEGPPFLGVVPALGVTIFLLITVGGVGAVINLLTVPDIRAYNRFSVYLSFFAITATSLWLGGFSGRRRIAGVAAALLLAAFSLYDQLLDVRGMVAMQAENVQRAQAERDAVNRLEEQFPPGSAVLQLPFTGYPPQSVINSMTSYDHGRPYLWSHDIRWSWPSFSQRHRTWQEKMKSLEGRDLVEAAVLSGFEAVWIDGEAYQDHGRQLAGSLVANGARAVDLGSKRYTVVDLRPAAAGLHASLPAAEFKRRAAELLAGKVTVDWKRGFYGEEKTPEGKVFHWAARNASIELHNLDDVPAHACVSFDIAVPAGGRVQVQGARAPASVEADVRPRAVRIPVDIGVDEKVSLRFSADGNRVDAPGDLRELYFYVASFSVSPAREDRNRSTACGGD